MQGDFKSRSIVDPNIIEPKSFIVESANGKKIDVLNFGRKKRTSRRNSDTIKILLILIVMVINILIFKEHFLEIINELFEFIISQAKVRN